MKSEHRHRTETTSKRQQHWEPITKLKQRTQNIGETNERVRPISNNLLHSSTMNLLRRPFLVALFLLIPNDNIVVGRFLRSEDSDDESDKIFNGGNGGGEGDGGTFEICEGYGGPPIRLWTLDEVSDFAPCEMNYCFLCLTPRPPCPCQYHQVAQNKSFCNTVFYDKVYHLDEFIPIHKGGPEPIIRNCGKDSTFLFENLQCISMVPDHFEGVLNMCNDYIVGVIKGSPEDPCSSKNWEAPTYPYPDFEACDVYQNITCTALPMLPNNGPRNGLWTMDEVREAQSHYFVDMVQNRTEHCYSVLHNWVYDFGVSPLDGSDPFYLKHGNGQYPQAVLKYCGKDMTEAFDRTVDQDRLCVPDHTLGGMNVLSGYVVGVLEGSDVDPCNVEPPTACETFHARNLARLTTSDFNSIQSGCPIIVLNKVYDLQQFAPYHYGGEDEILVSLFI